MHRNIYRQLNRGIGLLKQVSFEQSAKCRQRRSCSNMARQTVPDARSGCRERSAADRGESDRWHHETAGASRAERLSAGQVSDSNKRAEVLRASAAQRLISQHGDLELHALGDTEPMQAGKGVRDAVIAAQVEDQPSRRI